jgi:DNA-directed RNA polymerase specialized sigma24 family protein
MAEKPDETTKLLRALLMLAIDEREARVEAAPAAPKIEVLLASAGLDSSEIASLTGKQAGSVRVALSRARRTGGKTKKESGDG